METQEPSQDVTPTHEMSHNVTLLTPRQECAAQMLADDWLIKDIAKQLKVRRETVSRWQRRPEFHVAYERAIEKNKRKYLKQREEMRENLRHEVTHLMNEAIDTLNRQLNHTYDTLSDRSKLALDVLKFLKADQVWLPPKQ